MKLYECMDEFERRLMTFDGFGYYQMKFNANLGDGQATGI